MGHRWAGRADASETNLIMYYLLECKLKEFAWANAMHSSAWGQTNLLTVETCFVERELDEQPLSNLRDSGAAVHTKVCTISLNVGARVWHSGRRSEV